jgi:hypothetical protein
MEATTQLSDVLVLGKRLAAELDSDESSDTLSHWMAHHIADRISRLESHGAESLPGEEDECRRSILELWSHRSSLPGGSRPFGNMQQLLQTVDALNPDRPSFFYAREIDTLTGGSDQLNEQAQQWLTLAQSIDRGARTLVGYCLSKAAEGAVDQAAGWVELARKVQTTLDADIKFVRIIIDNSSMLKDVLPKDELSGVRELLERRVQRLDAMAQASTEIRRQLMERIDELKTAK